MLGRISEEVNSAMRFIVRRYDSVPTVDQSGEVGDNDGATELLENRSNHNRKTGASAAHDEDDTSDNTKLFDTLDLSLQDGNANQLSSKDQPKGRFSLDNLTDVSVDGAELLQVRGQIGKVEDRGRIFAKSHRRRLVHKNGDVNIIKVHMKNTRRKFFVDIFTTLLEIKWRFIILLFAAGFVLSWLMFAVMWYIIMIVHKDYEHIDDEDWIKCIENVYDFPTALLFSIETQHTIGYGSRMVNSQCLVNIPLLMFQSCLGVFIQALLAGLIFAKLSRPKKRSNTIMFSKTAVICKRDGELCLLFRVGDMRKAHIVGGAIRAVMVKNRLTAEGELIPLCCVPMKVEAETMMPEDNFVFLAWPVTVVHRINRESPLWDVSAEQLLQEKFEIVVILEGTVESTGMTTQLRTSYLPLEIQWGHHLSPLVTYQKQDGQYKIDYTQFHASSPIKMTEHSAKSLYLQAKNRTDFDKNKSDETEEREYPVNFTAPTQGMRQKRTWSSLRRPSLRGSLKKNASKLQGKKSVPSDSGNGRPTQTPSSAALLKGSLHSVQEGAHSETIDEHIVAAARKDRPASTSTTTPERFMKRSSSSPEHCLALEGKKEIRSADMADSEVF